MRTKLATPILTKNKIILKELDETIYFTHHVRGLNYNEITISRRPIGRLTANVGNNIIYSRDEKLFYKQINDTLMIYCSNIAKVPNNFHTQFKVKQIQYDIHKYNWLLTNYKKEGFSVFPDEKN